MSIVFGVITVLMIMVALWCTYRYREIEEENRYLELENDDLNEKISEIRGIVNNFNANRTVICAHSNAITAMGKISSVALRNKKRY